jgi:hypothetical protein
VLPDSPELRRYIEAGRNPGREAGYRTLYSANLYAVDLGSGIVGVQYHDTVIVGWIGEGLVVLDTGGWYTMSTRRHMETYSPVLVHNTGVGRRWAVGHPVVELARRNTAEDQAREIDEAMFGSDRPFRWYQESYIDVRARYQADNPRYARLSPFFDGMVVEASTGIVVGALDAPLRGLNTPRRKPAENWQTWYGPSTSRQMGPRVSREQAEADRAKWRAA